jgi:hypothetical protein
MSISWFTFGRIQVERDYDGQLYDYLTKTIYALESLAAAHAEEVPFEMMTLTRKDLPNCSCR